MWLLAVNFYEKSFNNILGFAWYNAIFFRRV